MRENTKSVHFFVNVFLWCENKSYDSFVVYLLCVSYFCNPKPVKFSFFCVRWCFDQILSTLARMFDIRTKQNSPTAYRFYLWKLASLWHGIVNNDLYNWQTFAYLFIGSGIKIYSLLRCINRPKFTKLHTDFQINCWVNSYVQLDNILRNLQEEFCKIVSNEICGYRKFNLQVYSKIKLKLLIHFVLVELHNLRFTVQYINNVEIL